jgi:hypothetical protein
VNRAASIVSAVFSFLTYDFSLACVLSLSSLAILAAYMSCTLRVRVSMSAL